jgi:hypothetical protein
MGASVMWGWCGAGLRSQPRFSRFLFERVLFERVLFEALFELSAELGAGS